MSFLTSGLKYDLFDVYGEIDRSSFASTLFCDAFSELCIQLHHSKLLCVCMHELLASISKMERSIGRELKRKRSDISLKWCKS